MKDDRLYLVHILECVERIEDYVRDGRGAFMGSRLIQDAVLRNLQTLTESTQHLSDTLNRNAKCRAFRQKLRCWNSDQIAGASQSHHISGKEYNLLTEEIENLRSQEQILIGIPTGLTHTIH